MTDPYTFGHVLGLLSGVVPGVVFGVLAAGRFVTARRNTLSDADGIPEREGGR